MIFLKREKRKVQHDATISVNTKLYEVPPILIGKQIEIRFDPETYEEIFIYDDDKCLAQAKAVIMADNAHVKRKNNISFYDINEKGDKHV